MSVYKKINIVGVIILVFVYVATSVYWNIHCSNLDCDEILIDGWLRPLLKSSFWAILIFGLLILFPGDVFKRWLQYILWWAVPLSLKLVYDISAHTGGIMSVSKADMAESLGQIFLIVTAIFIAAYYLITWWKKRKAGPVSAS